ncbi:MAG: M48 family metallopeptidase [Verrucomicrobia bacterium]|nr:M48 family metallopeptidase [Verrucomicrobiota bacterium]
MEQRSYVRLLPIVIALIAVAYKFLSTPSFVNPETGRKARVGLNPQQEQALGLQSYNQVLQEAGSNVVRSGPVVDQVTRVARRLAGAAAAHGQQQYNWRLSVVRSDQVNAFCLPGGEIVVYTAILPVTQHSAGLAVVMGHEMAHATSRHGAQRMFQQSVAQTLMTGAQFSLTNLDWNQQRAVMGALGAATQYGAILPFSREHESEADHIGLLYMARAGYDPQEAIKFWQRMEAQAGSGRQPAEFASDHPSHGHRIEQLKGWMPQALQEYEKAPEKVPASEALAPISGN